MTSASQFTADPTMLLSPEEWMEEIKDSRVQETEPYIFCYFLGTNIEAREAAVRLKEKTVQEILQSGRPDFPFCLGWANHSWTTKTWHGANGLNLNVGTEYIAKMVYPGREDDKAHFLYCLPAFKDDRYIKVDGKPLFYIWAPDNHPEMQQFIEYWQELAKENGLEGIHFVANVDSRGGEYDKYLELGFDAVNYNTMNHAKTIVAGSAFKRRLNTFLSWYIPGAKLNKYDYSDIVKNMVHPFLSNEECYPIILPGYDRTPRSGRAADILSDNNPQAFQKHVAATIAAVKGKKDEHKIIFLKSWNEWAEGNYMEPDLRWGHAFLDALKAEVFN